MSTTLMIKASCPNPLSHQPSPRIGLSFHVICSMIYEKQFDNGQIQIYLLIESYETNIDMKIEQDLSRKWAAWKD